MSDNPNTPDDTPQPPRAPKPGDASVSVAHAPGVVVITESRAYTPQTAAQVAKQIMAHASAAASKQVVVAAPAVGPTPNGRNLRITPG